VRGYRYIKGKKEKKKKKKGQSDKAMRIITIDGTHTL
jgi:hypothetical protein